MTTYRYPLAEQTTTDQELAIAKFLAAQPEQNATWSVLISHTGLSKSELTPMVERLERTGIVGASALAVWLTEKGKRWISP